MKRKIVLSLLCGMISSFSYAGQAMEQLQAAAAQDSNAAQSEWADGKSAPRSSALADAGMEGPATSLPPGSAQPKSVSEKPLYLAHDIGLYPPVAKGFDYGWLKVEKPANEMIRSNGVSALVGVILCVVLAPIALIAGLVTAFTQRDYRSV